MRTSTGGCSVYSTIEEELGVELQVGDLTDMFDPEDDSVESFLGLLDEINKEG